MLQDEPCFPNCFAWFIIFATYYVGWDAGWLRVSFDLFAGFAGNECRVRE